MIRVVLAAALSTALLAVSLPPMNEARHAHTDALLENAVERIERAAGDLVATNDPTVGVSARRHVRLRLPRAGWGRAGVREVRVHPVGGRSAGRVTWTLDGGGTAEVRIGTVSIGAPAGRSLVLRDPGGHRLVLSLEGTPGRPVVTVQRAATPGGRADA